MYGLPHQGRYFKPRPEKPLMKINPTMMYWLALTIKKVPKRIMNKKCDTDETLVLCFV